LLTKSNLSEYQKNVAFIIYDFGKHVFNNCKDMNNIVKITTLIGQLIQQVEKVRYNKQSPTGMDKKAIVLELCRIILLNDVELSDTYKLIAEATLEAMITVSKVIHIQPKCCFF